MAVLLFSSFEQALYIDSDNVALEDVTGAPHFVLDDFALLLTARLPKKSEPVTADHRLTEDQ